MTRTPKAQSFEDAEVLFADVRSHTVSLDLVDLWMPETSGRRGTV
jgi:hypothetical protein